MVNEQQIKKEYMEYCKQCFELKEEPETDYPSYLKHYRLMEKAQTLFQEYDGNYDKDHYDVVVGHYVVCQVWPNAGRWRDHNGNLLNSDEQRRPMWIRKSVFHPVEAAMYYRNYSLEEYLDIVEKPEEHRSAIATESLVHGVSREALNISIKRTLRTGIKPKSGYQLYQEGVKGIKAQHTFFDEMSYDEWYDRLSEERGREIIQPSVEYVMAPELKEPYREPICNDGHYLGLLPPASDKAFRDARKKKRKAKKKAQRRNRGK